MALSEGRVSKGARCRSYLFARSFAAMTTRDPSADAPTPWRAPLAAMCTLLIGIGLARFAYTPLIPALVAAQWLSPGDAAYLGAVNLVGYLAGALAARYAASRVALVPLLRAMMALATLAFFACAFPLGFWWFAPWRFLAGVAGGDPHGARPAERARTGGAGAARPGRRHHLHRRRVWHRRVGPAHAAAAARRRRAGRGAGWARSPSSSASPPGTDSPKRPLKRRRRSRPQRHRHRGPCARSMRNMA